MDNSVVAGLLTAILAGAAIGLERQRSGHATGARAHVGGLRTFTLLGTLAGVCGWLSSGRLYPFAIVLLTAAALLIVVSYWAASRTDIDGTTEMAALVVLAAGTLAGAGWLALASAIAAGTVLLLLEKTWLHTVVMRVDDAALRASARFAAMACIVLPLLPPGPYGPMQAVRPRELWAIVLFFSGLSFLGWIARRLVGASRGVVITGLLGGVISSTSVTLQFARESRRVDAPSLSLAGGAIGACTVMLVRVTAACAVLNAPLAMALLPYAVPPFVLGAAVLLATWRLNGHAASPAMPDDSPLQLRSALQMTALFQAVLFVIVAVRTRWSSEALVATSAFVGLTDLDALTLSLARGVPGTTDAPVVIALVAGILSNTLLKLTVALVVGRAKFRLLTVAVLGAMALIMVVLLRVWH